MAPPGRRVGPEPLMRPWLIISAVAHGTAVLLAVLFTSASPFDSVATEAIAVDIISSGDVPPDQPDPAAPEKLPAPPKESPLEFNFELGLSTTPQPPTPPVPSPTTKPAQQAAQPRAKEQQSARRPAAQAAASQAAAPRGDAPQGAAKPPPAASPPPPAAMQPPAAQEIDKEINKEANQPTSVADLFGMPLALPDGRLGGGFDAPAIETARIDRSSVEAFRAHMRTCAALPTGVSPGDKISLVVRVKLNADGTLAGPPTLIEGTASPKGPVLLQSLLSGLTKCQPYDMLPADKYQEWKSLDMRFTPEDLGQG
jgi:outer membrane biosynthesis protein TonB